MFLGRAWLAKLRNLTVFEDSSKQLTMAVHKKHRLPFHHDGVPATSSPPLVGSLVEVSVALEHMALSRMIHAEEFLTAAGRFDFQWLRLQTLALTTTCFRRKASQAPMENVLRMAGHTTRRMLKLEYMVI